MLIALAATGCVNNSILAAKSDCSALVPSAWRAGVVNAAAPATADNDLDRLKSWIAFGVGQTGQLDKANGRTVDALGIIERCETRDRAANEAAQPKFLGLL